MCVAQHYDIEVPGLEPAVAPVTKTVTLFQNVRVVDGTSATLSAPCNVLIKGNAIDQISTSPITVDGNANVQVIAGNGRVLMPGLIDAHWHSFMAATSQPVLMTPESAYFEIPSRSGHEV